MPLLCSNSSNGQSPYNVLQDPTPSVTFLHLSDLISYYCPTYCLHLQSHWSPYSAHWSSLRATLAARLLDGSFPRKPAELIPYLSQVFTQRSPTLSTLLKTAAVPHPTSLYSPYYFIVLFTMFAVYCLSSSLECKLHEGRVLFFSSVHKYILSLNMLLVLNTFC